MQTESTESQNHPLGPASFLQKIIDLRARNASRSAAGVLDPFGSKLHNYEYAESHGLQLPDILDAWKDVESIQLNNQPRKFALKSDIGHSGNGVLLLERSGADEFLIIGTNRTLTSAGVKQFFHGKAHRGHIGGPLFAESLLQPEREGDMFRQIPDDIKIYTANGRILQVLVRSVERLRDPKSTTWNYFDETGAPIGHMAYGRRIDEKIVPPSPWGKLIDTARHLSRRVGVAFMRVDLYSDGQNIFFGELTPSPGGDQNYDPSHDATMGRLWTESELKLNEDIEAGRPVGIQYGNMPWKSRFPPECRPNDNEYELPRIYASTCTYCIDAC